MITLTHGVTEVRTRRLRPPRQTRRGADPSRDQRQHNHRDVLQLQHRRTQSNRRILGGNQGDRQTIRQHKHGLHKM